jgi:hypothetical protein
LLFDLPVPPIVIATPSRKEPCVKLPMTLALCLTGALALLAQDPAAPPKLDPKISDRYLGTYELPSGQLLVIARTERRLYLYEPGSEQIRGLERVDDRTWIGGPSLLVYAPEKYRLIFLADASGDIASLRYVAGGTVATAKKARFYREEAVSFRNGDVTLSGTLLVLRRGEGAQVPDYDEAVRSAREDPRCATESFLRPARSTGVTAVSGTWRWRWASTRCPHGAASRVLCWQYLASSTRRRRYRPLFRD